LRDEAGMY